MPPLQRKLTFFIICGTVFLTSISFHFYPTFIHLNLHQFKPHLNFNPTTLLNHVSVTKFVDPTPSLQSSPPPTESSNWPYKPTFLINEPHICLNQTHTNSTPFFLIYIHSSTAHIDRRIFVRQTWAHPHFQHLFNFSIIFILGDPKNSTIQTTLDAESQTFHDIVQADFTDSYKNLAFKEISALLWASTYCPDAAFFVKADDDLVIKHWLLAGLLRKHLKESTEPLIWCKRCVNDFVHRDEESKWFVPLSVYPNMTFPPFCAGPIRVVTGTSVVLLAEGTQKVPYISLEDVFATGFVAEKMNVQRVHEVHLLVELNPKFKSAVVEYVKMDFAAAHAHTLANQRRTWVELIRNYPERFRGYELPAQQGSY